MAVFNWPATLVPRDINIMAPNETSASGASVTNFQQFYPVIRPPFQVELAFPTLTTEAQVLAYRAFIARFKGRANKVLLPLFDAYTAAPDAIRVPHSDGSTFSDGAYYLQDDIEGVEVAGTQGDASIDVDFGETGLTIKAGQYFGIDYHAYIATAVYIEGTVHTIEFSASLHKSYTEGRFRLKPYIVAGLAEDQGGAHPLSYGKWTAPKVNLIERFGDEYFS